MFVKVFVLGRPGSGKSTAIDRITELASRRNYPTTYMRDYTILLAMFNQDIKHEKFSPADWNGFDVLDFSVLDDALKQLEEQVEERIRKLKRSPSKKKEIIMIEFARDDYDKALSNFTSEFLEGAYFLFLEADLEACIKRIHDRRISDSSIMDHHSVSDFIMRSYYYTDNWLFTSQKLSAQDQSLHFEEPLNNNGSLETFKLQVGNFAQIIFDKEFGDNPSSNDSLMHDTHEKEMATA